MSLLIMVIGSFFIIFASLKALRHNNLIARFVFCGITQISYVVVGVGTAKSIGSAGAIFHAINCVIYIICLFLIGSAVKIRTGELALDKIGGSLMGSRAIFVSFLIIFLSISAVPPFSGFFSIWLISQGVIQGFLDPVGHFTMSLCLVAVLFGSIIMLVGFMQLLHAIFLAQPAKKDISRKQKRDIPWFIQYGALVLSSSCIFLGVFSDDFSKRFIYPFRGEISFIGKFSPYTLALVFVCGISLYLVFYRVARGKNLQSRTNYFVGVEDE
jgi:formate hydrogenlyase subunit 3/multisubunit Na+/H+ antiporter MnhD subunit